MTPEEAGDRCAQRYWQRGKGGNGRPIEAQTSRNWTSHTPTLTKTEEHPLLSQGIHPLQGDFFSCHSWQLAIWPPSRQFAHGQTRQRANRRLVLSSFRFGSALRPERTDLIAGLPHFAIGDCLEFLL